MTAGADERVDFKFILHPYTLRLGGDDGRVGDKREIVAEIGTANDDCCKQCNISVSLRGNTCSNGYQCYHGTDTCADRDRDEAGCDEEAREDQAGR